MYRIITKAVTTAATVVMTDYLALAVVLATMLAMSLDIVTGADGGSGRVHGPGDYQPGSMMRSMVPASSSAAFAPSRVGSRLLLASADQIQTRTDLARSHQG
jgi:hypothetical protein